MSWFGWLRRNKRQLSSSTHGYVGGRKHALGVPYALPQDSEEVNRLDFQHYLLRYAFRGNFAAPLDSPHAILDVGCGTGRWAREMAQAFPVARVVGLDINPPPADAGSAGPSRQGDFTFTPGNVLEGLPFPDATFDYTHMRLMFLAISANRWEFVARELIRVTRPGGWVEMVEAGPEEHGGPDLDRLLAWGTEMLQRRGIDANYGRHIGDLLQRARLAQVGSRDLAIPLGVWGERVGKMMETDFFSGIRALEGVIATMGIASREEFQRTLAAAQTYVNTPKARCVAPFYVAWGQRPV
jgi:SAM-dependent methyltransferase